MMGWSAYGEFLILATLLTLVPGPDFAVVTKNTLTAGRRRGRWTAFGVSCSNAVQGTAAVCGLSVLIVRAQPLFDTIKWAGVAYLSFLGVQAIRSAVRGRYAPMGPNPPADTAGGAVGGWRQGFISNITNPKVLIFYVAVLPQFLGRGARLGWLVAFAGSHSVIGLVYLVGLSSGLHRARHFLFRRPVRRATEGLTGAALLGFGARLAAEHP